MITKQNEAKKKILKGINETVDVVKLTMGARGSTVMIVGDMGLSTHITKDGITVANSVYFKDSIENQGSKLVKAASKKTVDEAGDSTTTTAVLTQSLCNGVMKYIEMGQDPNKLRRDLLDDLNTVKEHLKKNSFMIENTKDIKNIAMVSSNYDEEISDIIENIYSELGNDVIIDVKGGDTEKSRYETLSGLILPNTGFANPIFINNYEKSRVEYLNPKIYVLNSHVKTFGEDLTRLIGNHINNNCEEPIVLITNYIEDMPLRTLMSAIHDEQLRNFTVVMSNLLSDVREDRFKDLCAYTNAEYSDNIIGLPGTCEKILISKSDLTIINGHGDVSKRIKDIEKRLEKFENGNVELEDRLFSLQSKAALIIVGGKLVNTVKERVDRVEDAVLSVKAALEEGYCAGGGTTFLKISNLQDLKTDIMRDALKSCYIQIMRNADKEPYEFYSEIVKSKKGKTLGYDVLSEKVVDVIDAGIIDSVKSLRVSIENATETAITFMSINAVVNLE